MPWRMITPMSERLMLCKMALEEGYFISELADKFGVSRKTAYKWIGRYKDIGVEGLWDQPKTPKHVPGKVDDEIEAFVVALKDFYKGFGARKLLPHVTEEYGAGAVSKTTIERILARHGLSVEKLHSLTADEVGRWERGKPNELWQIDFTAPFLMPDGRKVWPVPVLDDNTRYSLSILATDAPTCENALSSVRAAASRYGLPEEVLSDHGSAFGTSKNKLTEFTVFLWALGVGHIQGRYAHPETQGKLERFNQTLNKECIRWHSYSSLDDWNKCFEDYRHLYNEERVHESLGDVVPASKYTPSTQGFVEPDKRYKEQGEDILHRVVDSSGKIWLHQHHAKIGNGFSGWTVSCRHDGGGIWSVSFRGHDICQVELAKQALYKPRP